MIKVLGLVLLTCIKAWTCTHLLDSSPYEKYDYKWCNYYCGGAVNFVQSSNWCKLLETLFLEVMGVVLYTLFQTVSIESGNSLTSLKGSGLQAFFRGVHVFDKQCQWRSLLKINKVWNVEIFTQRGKWLIYVFFSSEAFILSLLKIDKNIKCGDFYTLVVRQ